MVNKHTIVVTASILVIAGSLGYSSLNMISANSLEFGWPGQSFDFLSTLTGKVIEVCNNSDYPATFSKFSFTIIYDENDLGTYSTGSGGFAAHTGGKVFGKFESKDDRMSGLFFSFLDTEFGGTDVTRINTEKIKVTTQVDTAIFGVIPFSITEEYSGQEFLDLINKKLNCDV